MGALAEDLRRDTRWPVLDGWRGVAALAVVGYHAIRRIPAAHDLITRASPPVAIWPLGLGKFAVSGFFVLSGFLIVAAWDRRPELGRFFRRRVRRLWPAYLVSVAILVPLVDPGVIGSVGDAVLLLTLQGNLEPRLVNTIDVPWWSLTTEVHFYLLVPLLAPLLHRRLGRWALVVGALGLSWWWWAVGASAVDLPGSSLPGRLPQFLFGALVGIAVRDRAHWPRAWAVGASRTTWRLSLAALVALGVYFGANGTRHDRDVLFDLWLEPLVGAVLALLLLHAVVRAAEGHRSVLAGPVLRGAGLVSYSLYLWHYPILLLSLRHFDVAGDTRRAAYAVPLALALTALVTWLSWRFVERPLLHRSTDFDRRAMRQSASDRQQKSSSRSGEVSLAIDRAGATPTAIKT